MTVDFSKLDKLSQGGEDKSNSRVNRISKTSLNAISALQHKSDLKKKEIDFYYDILEETHAIKSEIQSNVSILIKMIEDEAPLSKLFIEAFSKLLNLTNAPGNHREYIQLIALEKRNEIARIIAYEDVARLLRNMNQAYIENVYDDVGSRMRLENAIKKHEELLKKLSRTES